MATVHILNGNCLAEQLRLTSIKDEFTICGECLIEGPVKADSFDGFLNVRADYISKTYSVTKEEYLSRTGSELTRIKNIPENSKVFLWFENDLFCQVNLWFVMSLLSDKNAINLFRIFPYIKDKTDYWKGFGIAAPEDLEEAYKNAVELNDDDVQFGKHLWEAFAENNFSELNILAGKNSNAFSDLKEVVAANLERFPQNGTEERPEKTLRNIIQNGTTGFQNIFSEFSRREGVYGFSDEQVRRMLERVVGNS